MSSTKVRGFNKGVIATKARGFTKVRGFHKSVITIKVQGFSKGGKQRYFQRSIT